MDINQYISKQQELAPAKKAEEPEAKDQSGSLDIALELARRDAEAKKNQKPPEFKPPVNPSIY